MYIYPILKQVNPKKMKKLLLVCCFVAGISAVSYAQGGGRRTPAEQVDRLKTQITGITDDQAAKIKVIYEAQSKSQDSLRTALGDGADRAVRMQKSAPITAAANAKVKALLTTDQATAFQKVLDEQAERMKQRMQGN
jgi:protein CpxP